MHSSLHRAPLVLAGLLLCAPLRPVAAQATGSGGVEGIVYDSVQARPRAGATVTVMQVSPAPQQYFTATTDSLGRYRVDSLVAGQFLVGFSTTFLDSLELQFPQRSLTLAGAQRTTVDFATPSRATLARAACPGSELPKGRGGIIGQVSDAEKEVPLRGATVVMHWTELSVDLKAMRPVSEVRTGAVTTDSLGQFRICGVPTDTYIALQVQHAGKAGTPFRATVADAAGVLLQNLSLSGYSARDLAAADAGSAGRDTAVALLSGTAAVAGTVRSFDGQPLANAQLRIVDAAGTGRSDATGHYSLGNLPAGTQLLEIRHVGYLLAQQPVELRAGRTVTSDVRLSRIVTLDSVRVVAQRVRLQEFERRAGKGSNAGTLLREPQLQALHLRETSDLFRNMLGFTIVGQGLDAKVRSARGLASLDLACNANIVIDGMQHQEINLIAPETIAAIEVYRGAAGAPPEYDSPCGAVIIWTKR